MDFEPLVEPESRIKAVGRAVNPLAWIKRGISFLFATKRQ